MLTITKHPLITHKLSILRCKDTGTKEFREILNEIAALMAYDISRDFPLKESTIETPIEQFTTGVMSSEIVLIPVLRAGLGMVEGISELMPTARVGHIGLYRDHETLMPRSYYSKLPDNISDSIIMVLDPMLATGGSASAAITILKKHGAKRIKLICMVGAPEGVEKVKKDHPDTDIFLAALDKGLNDDGYIVPGLGDAGDRLFGTK